MTNTGHAAILVGIMSAVTILLRFLPFIVFRKHTPPFVLYLGRVLPPAMIGLLVIYCLKDVTPAAYPHGLPELIAAVIVVALQAWKRNSLLSILAGTVAYMVLVQAAF